MSTRERQEKATNTLGNTRERHGTWGTAAGTHSIEDLLIFHDIMVRTFPYTQLSALNSDPASKLSYSNYKYCFTFFLINAFKNPLVGSYH